VSVATHISTLYLFGSLQGAFVFLRNLQGAFVSLLQTRMELSRLF
jgi:hypothetical protein